MGKKSRSCGDLDLGPIVPNFELILERLFSCTYTRLFSSYMILGECALQLPCSQPHGNTYPHIE